MARGNSTSAVMTGSRSRTCRAGGAARSRRPGRRSSPSCASATAEPGTGAPSRCLRPGSALRCSCASAPSITMRALLVNRTLVAENEGGWLPFEAEIGALLRPEANEVAVHVTAPTDDPAAYPEYPFAEILAGKQSWYGPQGGIWQSVLLERRAPDHLRLLRLRPRRDGRRGRDHGRSRAAALGPAPARAPDHRTRGPDGASRKLAARCARGAGHGLPRGPRAAGLVAGRASSVRADGGVAAGRRSGRPPARALRLPLDRDPRRPDLPERGADLPARRARSGLLPRWDRHGAIGGLSRGSVPQGQGAGAQLPALPHQGARSALLRRCRPRRPPDLDRAAERGPAHAAGARTGGGDAARDPRARRQSSLHRLLDDPQRELGQRPGSQRRGSRLASPHGGLAQGRGPRPPGGRQLAARAELSFAFRPRGLPFLCRDARSSPELGRVRRGPLRPAGMDLWPGGRGGADRRRAPALLGVRELGPARPAAVAGRRGRRAVVVRDRARLG